MEAGPPDARLRREQCRAAQRSAAAVERDDDGCPGGEGGADGSSRSSSSSSTLWGHGAWAPRARECGLPARSEVLAFVGGWSVMMGVMALLAAAGARARVVFQ